MQDKIEQMQLVEKAIRDTTEVIQEEHTVDWSRMLNLIHLTGMEKSLKNQYQDCLLYTSGQVDAVDGLSGRLQTFFGRCGGTIGGTGKEGCM